jgi:hypothetical protein
MQTFWARVREHKVIQWGVAYLGAALALAHGAELVTHALLYDCCFYVAAIAERRAQAAGRATRMALLLYA